MERNWTQIGKEETEGKEIEFGNMFDRLEWETIPCSMAMGPGLAIKAVIKELRLPKVTHVAYSHEAAPYGLCGIRCHYKNGMAQVYFLDRGSDSLIICSDFHPNVVKLVTEELVVTTHELKD